MKPKNANNLLDVATVGIITALPQEYAAVCQVLDLTTEVAADGQGAGRKYAVGRVRAKSGDEHVVAVALLTGMGNNSAAIRATQMAGHCPKIDHFIMTGIAGAVPNPGKADDHVRLGDIVISDKNGVIQYDLDKEEKEFIEHRHPPRPPSAALIEAVNSLTTGQLQNKYPWESYLNEGVKKLGKAWKKPPAKDDLLKDTIDETAATPHPKDSGRRMGKPRVFHGAIASANKLLKNPEKRDALRDKFKVKAVEMEASGIADSTWQLEKGYLVVRGTCDYCNPSKGDAWQKYASLAAASYTRCVIEELTTSAKPSASTQKRKATKKGAKKKTTPKKQDHQHDLKQLKRLFYWININMFDNYIYRMANHGRLQLNAMNFCDSVTEVLNSAAFHLYDQDLKKRVIAFYKAWVKTRKYSEQMDLAKNGKEAFFPMPGDVFKSVEQKRQYDFTVSQARPLRKALDALLGYVRAHYAELDLSETGVEAIEKYAS